MLVDLVIRPTKQCLLLDTLKAPVETEGADYTQIIM